ncbi:hypothetical protein ACM66B_000284 [Microbotryomycetes sp. NB124-2]
MSAVSSWVEQAATAVVERNIAASATASSIASQAASIAARHLHHHNNKQDWSSGSTWVDMIDVNLPSQLSLLPAMFRTIAFMCVLPVLALTLGDVIGWAIFKLVLRPLGYASTVRYKDPEPTDAIKVGAYGTSSAVRGKSKPRSRAIDNLKQQADDDRVSVPDGNKKKKQRPSSLPAPLRRVRDSSPDLNAFELDSSALKNGSGDGQDAKEGTRADDDSSSSNAPSPVLSYGSLSRSPSASPSNSPRSPVLVLPMSSSSPKNHNNKANRPRRQRSLSETSTGSSVSAGLQRFRAPSIGWDGPLLAGEDGLLSPARSDDEALAGFAADAGAATASGDSDVDGEDESNGDATTTDGAGGLRKRKARVAGAPKRGPKFDFTSME